MRKRIPTSQLKLTTNIFENVDESINYTVFHEKKIEPTIKFFNEFFFGINFNICNQVKRKMEIIFLKKEHFLLKRHATTRLHLFYSRKRKNYLNFL